MSGRAGGTPLDSRWAPAACGAVAALLVLAVWGSFGASPLMHDEWAYWTQGSQYARLRWAEPAPPIPEFFEQLYVLVTPVFAAKYWPGHAMTIAPGFAIGWPALVPLVLTGVTGALVFALARRVAGAWVAALTFVLWVSTFGNLRFRASYFSEVTTSCAWVVAWWALLHWRESPRRRWMVVLAVATGWGAITRPATMFVFAIPIGVVVLRDAWRANGPARWKQVGLGIACGTLVLAVLPLWSARVTGDWRTTPLATYTRQYLPFDVPGYSVRATPPDRALPPEMERVRNFLHDIKAEQAAAPAWQTFAGRAGLLLRDAFAGWRIPFVLAFAVGLVVVGPAGWFAIGTSLLLVVAYVTQAHTADWSIYYLETYPAIAFIAAVGVRAIVVAAAHRLPARRLPSGASALDAPGSTGSVGSSWPTWAVASVAVAACLGIALDTVRARATLGRVATHTRAFGAGVAALPRTPNIVFVRYDARRNMHLSLVANAGNLDRAPSWIVHDRGADNLRLMDAAPGRTAYLYDESRDRFYEMTR